MHKAIKFLIGRTAKNSYITIGANIIYGLLVMAFFIIVSRLLGPEKFGLISIALAIFTICFDILSLGSSQALVRFVSASLGKNHTKKAHQFSSAIFRLRLIEAVVLVLLGQFLGQFIAINIYHQPQLIQPITLAIIAASGILLHEFMLSLTQSYENFKKSAVLLLFSGTLKLFFLSLIFATNNFTVLLATAAFVLTPLIAAGLGFLNLPNDFILVTPSKKTISQIFHFSKWMALWGMTASLAGRIDILLMGKLSSAYETGIYSAASRLGLGFIIIGSSYASVLVPKISRLIGNKTKLRHQFKLISYSVALVCLGIGLIAFISPWIIPFIFGSQYAQSSLVFQSLCLASIFFMASIPANTNLLSLGCSRFIGVLSVLQLLVVITFSWWLIPIFGAQGAAIALIASYLFSFILSTSYALKKIYT